MRKRNLLAIAVAAFTVGVVAPGNTQAQSYSYSYHSYGSGYGSSYGSHYGRGYYDSYPRYGDSYRKYHHVHGWNHPKYKNGRKNHHRKPDISIGPRWDRDHGWVYY